MSGFLFSVFTSFALTFVAFSMCDIDFWWLRRRVGMDGWEGGEKERWGTRGKGFMRKEIEDGNGDEDEYGW